MSTVWLTVSVVLIVGLFLRAAAELYHRRLIAASALAAAAFAATHITFVAVAWKSAATSEDLSGVASLPTAAYDTTAWIALVLLVVAAVGNGVYAIHLHRRRKAVERYFEHIFGLYKADED